MSRNPEYSSYTPDLELNLQKRGEVMEAVTPVVQENLGLLLDPAKAWEPSSILPDPQSDDFFEVEEEARLLTPEVKIVIVGSLITEDGLPNFTAEISKHSPHGVSEEEDSPWEIWRNGWASEEDRHGKLIGMYVRDSGGFQTEQIERDVHAYIAAGFYPGMKGDPYEATMYAAWQERATQDSHKGLSRIAGEVGASHLHKAAGVMAGDEGRHAKFYKTIAGEIFRLDPENAISSFERLVRRGLTMPGDTMQGYNAVIEASTRAGIYGPQEYLDILQELINEWGIGEISLSGNADRKRYEIINRHARLSKIIQRGANREPNDALNVMEERWLK